MNAIYLLQYHLQEMVGISEFNCHASFSAPKSRIAHNSLNLSLSEL